MGSDIGSDSNSGSGGGSGGESPEKKPRPLKWRTPAAALAAALALAGVLYVVFPGASKPATGDLARYARGAMAKLEILADAPPQPDESFEDAAGRPVRLSDYRGKIVLMNLWATWCAPCREEMPKLAALAARYEGRGLIVAPISIDEAAAMPEAKRVLASLSGGALAFLGDPSRGVAFNVRAPGLPTSVLYDREGREIARLPGGADWSSPEAMALIDAALAKGE